MKSLDDGFLPMHKEDHQALEESRAKRRQYWGALKDARAEYLADNAGVLDLTARPTLHYWMEGKYGIKMGIDGQGNYTDSYSVVDPKKFMLFQIKHFK